MISGNGFMLDARQQGVELFEISLDGLDRMIEDRTPDPVPNSALESLEQRVPEFLHYCLDFFSKEKSDTLPPHRSIDHKIELTEENTLGFYHLNKHSLVELTSIRDYLTDNLVKGFIVLSKAPFISLVLFV